MNDLSPIIECRGVSRRFSHGGAAATTVLHEIDLTVDDGDFLVLTGPSGSGKTTLLSCLSGMDRPSSGSVRLMGVELDDLDEDALAALRRESLGFAFQRTELLDELLVLDNILLPAFRRRHRVSTATTEWVAELMERLEIGDLGSRRPMELSGGQRQRVGICRALVNRPRVFFGDEPTAALHREAAAMVLDLFDDLNAAGTTVVVVTHDPVVAARASTRLHLVDGGLAPVRPELGVVPDQTVDPAATASRNPV